MQIKLNKSSIMVILYVTIYMIFMNTPYALARNLVIKDIFIICRLFIIGLSIIYLVLKKTSWNKYDKYIILYCMMIFLSAIHAGVNQDIRQTNIEYYIYKAISLFVNIFGNLVLIKVIFSLPIIQRISATKCVFYYYLSLCIINIITQIYGKSYYEKGNEGNIFFLGNDNSAAIYYICALFFYYVVKLLDNNYYKIISYIVVGITIFEAVYRQMATLLVISIFILIIEIIYILFDDTIIWNVSLNKCLAIIIGIYVLIMLSFTNSEILIALVNRHLYGKVSSLAVRFDIQFALLNLWKMHPWLGIGYNLQRNEWGNELWAYFAIRNGQSHNYLVEVLCNYGVIAFVIYLLLINRALKIINEKGKLPTVIGLVFLGFFSYGLFSMNAEHVFKLLPSLYYIGIMIENKMEKIVKHEY